MSQQDWDAASSAALALFQFGQEQAASRGLLLVDTKYEFGKDQEGNILLIDEVGGNRQLLGQHIRLGCCQQQACSSHVILQPAVCPPSACQQSTGKLVVQKWAHLCSAQQHVHILCTVCPHHPYLTRQTPAATGWQTATRRGMQPGRSRRISTRSSCGCGSGSAATLTRTRCGWGLHCRVVFGADRQIQRALCDVLCLLEARPLCCVEGMACAEHVPTAA